jgi:hypothetical protein
MNTVTTRMIAIGVLYVLMILTGIFLTKKGKPYHPLAVNLHKFITLAMLVLAVIQVISMFKANSISGLVWVAVILAAVLFLIEMISGGILSASKVEKPLVAKSHKIVPVLLTLAIVFLFYWTYR